MSQPTTTADGRSGVEGASRIDAQRTARHTARRADIDGLRGLAIALVVAFHIFVGKVSSGVDIFLLIGGIFFFSSQWRNATTTHGMTIVQALTRIIRRLFPSLAVVVAGTFALSLIVYPTFRWPSVAGDAIASLLYYQNLHLAALNQDYAALDSAVSMYQHLWSMSAQFQIYVASLVVITLVAVITRRLPRSKAYFVTLLAVATAASFAYSVYAHNTNQGLNYYSPLSRFWEIGLGGLIGFKLLGMRLPQSLERARTPTAILGLLLIGGTGILLNGAQQFPGPATLIPIGGAILVIIACSPTEAASAGPVADMLNSRPLQFLGRISYPLYLWHWPILVLVTYVFSRLTGSVVNSARHSGVVALLGAGYGLLVGAIVIVSSCVLSVVTLNAIEKPLRQTTKPQRAWVPRRVVLPHLGDRSQRSQLLSGAVVLTCTLLTFAYSGKVLSSGYDTYERIDSTSLSPEYYPGPRSLTQHAAQQPESSSRTDILPSPAAPTDNLFAKTDDDGCAALFEHTDLILYHQRNTTDIPCAYGDTDSERTIYLAGSSHSDHLLPGVSLAAQRAGIKIIPLLKMGCPLGGEPRHSEGADYPECAVWQQNVMRWVLENPPTDGLIFTTTHPGIAQRGVEQVPQGYVDMARELSNAGIKLWGFRDTPWPHRDGIPLDVKSCIADGFYNPDRGEDCGMARDTVLQPTNPAVVAFQGIPITHIDLSDSLCDAERCPGVIGQIMVYRDSSHLTNLYAALLSDEIYYQMFEQPAEG